MTHSRLAFAAITLATLPLLAEEAPPAFPEDPAQSMERTSFQTSKAWSLLGNLRADVAMVYGIGNGLAERVASWRDRGYRVHSMTGVLVLVPELHFARHLHGSHHNHG